MDSGDGGVIMTTFTVLPSNFTFPGNAGKVPAVNSGEDALEAVDATLLQYGFDAGSPADVQVVGGSVVGNPALGTPVFAPAHGFVTGNALYVSAANTYALARADAEATLGGYVCQKIDDDNFRLVQGGSLELSGLTATKTYYLSDATAGLLVVEESKPTASGSYLLSIGQAISTTTLVVMPQDAQEIA